MDVHANAFASSRHVCSHVMARSLGAATSSCNTPLKGSTCSMYRRSPTHRPSFWFGVDWVDTRSDHLCFLCFFPACFEVAKGHDVNGQSPSGRDTAAGKV